MLHKISKEYEIPKDLFNKIKTSLVINNNSVSEEL